MLDRLLAVVLRLVVTGLIAGIAAVAVLSAYVGFTNLVRVHLWQASWMLGVGIVGGAVAYLLATRRDDLADC